MKRTFLTSSSLSLASAVLGCCVAWAAQATPAHTQPVAASPAMLEMPSAQELAQRQSDRAAEREDIRRQRSVVRAELAEREKACWQKFAVENCLSKERAHAREQERVLRARDLLVSQRERQERADLRLGEIARKQADRPLPGPMDSTARPPLPGSASAEVEQVQRSRAQEAQQRAQAQQQRQREHAAEVQAREASEAQRRANAQRDYDAKQREAAERRAVKQAEIEGRRGQPLALPEGASAPSAP